MQNSLSSRELQSHWWTWATSKQQKKTKFHISPSRKKGFSWFVKKSGNRVNKVLWSFQKIYFHGKKATKSDGWKREDAKKKKLRKASLPWDFLCVPKKTFFLLRIAMNKDLILVRSKKYLILDLFDFYSSFSCLRSTWSHKTHHFQLTNDGCRTEGYTGEKYTFPQRTVCKQLEARFSRKKIVKTQKRSSLVRS